MILGEDRKIGLCRAARKIIHYEIKGIPIDYALFHPAVLSEFRSLGIGVAIREVPAPLVTRSDIERNLSVLVGPRNEAYCAIFPFHREIVEANSLIGDRSDSG